MNSTVQLVMIRYGGACTPNALYTLYKAFTAYSGTRRGTAVLYSSRYGYAMVYCHCTRATFTSH